MDNGQWTIGYGHLVVSNGHLEWVMGIWSGLWAFGVGNGQRARAIDNGQLAGLYTHL
jgi:hypothetical protein